MNSEKNQSAESAVRRPSSGLRRLFCWSGGGLPGLDIHAGIWKALTELEITPAANAGTSAGAIMAAFCSAGIAQSDIERTLRSLSDGDVRAERFAWKVRAPWIDWFLDNILIRALLTKLLPPRFMDLRLPLSIVATRVRDGAQTFFTERQSASVSLIDAILASMAISGVFPLVNINGEHYADGGGRASSRPRPRRSVALHKNGSRGRSPPSTPRGTLPRQSRSSRSHSPSFKNIGFDHAFFPSQSTSSTLTYFEGRNQLGNDALVSKQSLPGYST